VSVPKVSEALRRTETALNALDSKLDRLVADEEAVLAQPSHAAPRDHAARLERAAEALLGEARAIEASPASPVRRASWVEIAAKLEPAIEAMDRVIEMLQDRTAKLEAEAAAWQTRAEAAVREGDDERARHALGGRAATATAANACRAELRAREEALAGWRELRARVRGQR
jgi:hypothetical protein